MTAPLPPSGITADRDAWRASFASSAAPTVQQYRGWDVTCDTRCPDPWSTWVGTAPGWEPQYDVETGTWFAGKGCVRARTYEQLTSEIDDAIEEGDL